MATRALALSSCLIGACCQTGPPTPSPPYSQLPPQMQPLGTAPAQRGAGACGCCFFLSNHFGKSWETGAGHVHQPGSHLQPYRLDAQNTTIHKISQEDFFKSQV